MTPDIESRIKMIEDRAQLTELVGRYSQCVSQGLGQELVNMFTADGNFIAGKARATGHNELEAIFLHMSPGNLVPLVTNLTLQVDGDRATGSSTLFSVIPGDEIKTYAGYYEDEFVRTDGSWKFSKRHFTFFYDQAGRA